MLPADALPAALSRGTVLGITSVTTDHRTLHGKWLIRWSSAHLESMLRSRPLQLPPCAGLYLAER
eukprot:2049173-Rhodomonas_salina.2